MTADRDSGSVGAEKETHEIVSTDAVLGLETMFAFEAIVDSLQQQSKGLDHAVAGQCGRKRNRPRSGPPAIEDLVLADHARQIALVELDDQRQTVEIQTDARGVVGQVLECLAVVDRLRHL